MTQFSDEKVRWGVIGAGDVCEVKSAPAMQRLDDSDVVAVMRRDRAKVQDYAARHGVPRWYSDAAQLIDDPDVNAIYVATPPYAHRDLTISALAAGKPVYVEKPMARTHRECLEMIAASETADLPLFVAYYRRALPHFIKAKELIDSGAIGDVRHVRIVLNQPLDPALVSRSDHNWRVDPAIAGGGYFYDLASHQLDLLDYLLGPIRHAQGVARNQAGAYDAEDIVMATLEFESGVLGSGSWCFTTSDASTTDDMTIVGSLGEIRFETFGAGQLTLATDTGGAETWRFDLPRHIQEPLIAMVVDELLGKGRCPSTGVTAARTNWVMEQICGTDR